MNLKNRQNSIRVQGWGLTRKCHEKTFWNDENIVCLDWDGSNIGIYIYDN